MDMKTLLAASLEGVIPDLGPIEGAAVPDDFQDMNLDQAAPGEVAREKLLEEAAVALESHYDSTDTIFTQSNQLQSFAEENEEAHRKLQNEVADLRQQMAVCSGTMEMLALVRSHESLSADTVRFMNVTVENLVRGTDHVAPSLEAIDGKLTEPSMEGLLDLIKSAAKAVKNWFKDISDNMELNKMRQAGHGAAFHARIRRLQGILSSMPEEYGIPTAKINYRDDYLSGLYDDGKPVEPTVKAYTATLKAAMQTSTFALTDHAKERLHLPREVSAKIADVLVSPGDDGGEGKAKAMVANLKPLEGFAKALQFGKELAGGVTYRQPNYTPSLRVASWYQVVVELIEKPYFSPTYRRSGRFTGQYLKLEEIAELLDMMAGEINDRMDKADSYFGDARECYNESVAAYNKTFALARTMNHSSLTSEVWRAVDICSYAMMDAFRNMSYELQVLSIAQMKFIDGLLYVIEEQVKQYHKLNR